MHCISIQIQPEFSRTFNQEELLLRVRSVRSPVIDRIEERNRLYLNFNFFTERPAQLWQQLKSYLYSDPVYSATLAPVSIAICENDNEEVLLLHHFDPEEPLDQLT